jgi:MFS superfamily sulfate permease-like transporter
LRGDLFAGITLGAYAVPEGVAYATLAGLPPQVGIYGYLLGGLGYALFGSSRHLAIGPTSAISLMVGVSVAPLAMGDPVRYAQIATLSAFVVAAMCIVAWLLRLSTLINFISETVMLGFKAGAGLSIAATQIPALLGIPGGGHNFIERVFAIVNQFLQVHPLVLGIGIASLALLWLGEKFLPSRPIALFLVVISVAFVSMTHLAGHVVTVGEIPSGLPRFSPPMLGIGEVDGILPLAFAALLLSYMESVSAARAFAAKYSYKLECTAGTPGYRKRKSPRRFRTGLSGCGRPLSIGGERASRSKDSFIACLRVDHTGILSAFFYGAFTKLT